MSKLKIIIIFFVVIIIGIAIYNYNQLPIEPNEIITNNNDQFAKIVGPKIEVTPEFYDLGDVVYGEVAEHTFIVKNLGSEPLEILRLSTSCGCTTAEIAEEDKMIAPGESVDMIVAFDPAVMDDPTLTGSVERVVYIRTNDPDKPEVEVDLTANVINSQK